MGTLTWVCVNVKPPGDRRVLVVELDLPGFHFGYPFLGNSHDMKSWLQFEVA